MFLQEPEQTQFDLRFPLFGIAVRVHPWFWIVTVFLGWNALQKGGPEGFRDLFIWVACVFVSILFHELGHVCMGQVFGAHGHIVLYSLGGLAVQSANLPYRWQRIAVMFAGPLAGFLFLAGVMLLVAAFYDADLAITLLAQAVDIPKFYHGETLPPEWLVVVLRQLVWINLLWGLVNLLPIWPLDGGQISRELCTAGFVQGLRISLIISIVVATVFALNSLISKMQDKPFIPYLPAGDVFGIIFFAFLAFGSFQLLQHARAGSPGRHRFEQESYERAPWERDSDWWKRG